jgi:hypothetical protein
MGTCAVRMPSEYRFSLEHVYHVISTVSVPRDQYSMSTT